MADIVIPINTGKKNVDALIKCVLQIIIINPEYKPLLLAAVETVETFASVAVTTLEATLAPVNGLFTVVEAQYNSVRDQYNSIISTINSLIPFNKLTTPCEPINNIVLATKQNLMNSGAAKAFSAGTASIDETLKKFEEDYSALKKKVLAIEAQIASWLSLKEQFAKLKEEIKKLPDAPSIVIGG